MEIALDKESPIQGIVYTRARYRNTGSKSRTPRSGFTAESRMSGDGARPPWLLFRKLYGLRERECNLGALRCALLGSRRPTAPLTSVGLSARRARARPQPRRAGNAYASNNC
jgi:hypothetical protein